VTDRAGRRISARRLRRGGACALLLVGAAVAAVSLRQMTRTPSAAAPRCLVAVGESDATFARNFNPFANPLDFTLGGIYEPLIVVAPGGRRIYDWLASRLVWSRDRRTLTITVRPGVRWSDGRPLTSRDVAYTLTAGRQDRAMDQIGLTRPGNDVASVELVGDDQVAIHLARINSTFVSEVLAPDVQVVPEHVFARIRHVATWTNPHPVGTGPFTVVGQFGAQAYVLGKNPHYWLAGAPHIPCVKRVFAPSGESSLLQLDRGEADVSRDFVPDASAGYVAHDPEHFHYFYPASSAPIGLFLDDTRYPFSLVSFRQAVSLAINRKLITRLAEHSYAPPVDAIGVERAWPGWTDPSVAREAARLATYDPRAAVRLLRAAGFTYDGDKLVDPRGRPVVIQAGVIASWSDWVTAWRIMARDLGAIGITVKLRQAPSFGAWAGDAFSTTSATMLWSVGQGATPYGYFAANLDRAAFIPSRHDATRTGNWAHFTSPEGTRLLRAFRNTFDLREQHRIATRLGQLWLRTLPFVPLFAAPAWSTYSTRHFVGFPSRSDDYVAPVFSDSDYVVALSRIRPAPPS
jgi:peptide/nickel transport system substrate-binding protein